MYAIVTALVAFFLMPPDDPAYVPQVIGIMTNTMLHKIAPIMAVIDFVLFDPHRRFRWHYMFSWLAYFPAYLVFVLARAAIWPGPDRRPAAVRIRTTSSTSTHSAGKGSALAAASWP